ncbi:hypothetical protein [Methanosalsum natronophilum]|uniref:Glycerophosphoryl diester phosphodiesterase membrane domain-containing protein n=1 Tax=Methanosalsum natronophilum TaxID=768733 RepID=A0A3R7VYW4_9EURY|nr:hypothetical protein [Methanosalsum natronophilum]MCS3924665.1 hypothetical protein [Methanosalsum natronophilum]RQD89441.1 MAG: hypothetical protein D5R95_02200 [Methanosalsum natronophilum]
MSSSSLDTVLEQGFRAWTRNLKISVPFILSLLVVGLIWTAYAIILALFVAIPAFYTAQLDLGVMGMHTLYTFLPYIEPYLIPVIASFVLVMIISMLVQSFFTSGAIGMSRSAAITGHASYEDMVNYGKLFAVRYFFLQIIYYIVILVGAVFTIPGILRLMGLQTYTPDTVIPNITPLLGGFGVWFIYSVIVTLLLSVMYYALVVDDRGIFSSVLASIKFFFANKAAVIILWVIIITVMVVLNMVDIVTMQFEYLATLWSAVTFIISVAVIPAVLTVWWTFLYIGKTGWTIHGTTENENGKEKGKEEKETVVE